MNKDLKNILSDSNKDIDNQQLMDYLSNKLSESEKHAIEKEMIEDDFMNDAVEGLEQIKTSGQIPSYVDQLNRDLQKQLSKKKLRKEKRKLKDQPYIYYTIILVLMLLIIGFIVIKQFFSH